MRYCDRCGVGPGVGGDLTPLVGTERAFCSYCADVVGALARALERCGLTLDETLSHISGRFSRPPIATDDTMESHAPKQTG